MGNGNIFVPLDRVEELENRIQDVPLVLLNGSWVREEDENGNLLYYRQDVEVKGLSADSTPMIFPKWAGEEPVEEELNAYDCLIGEPIITEGNVRFMANPMPQWSFTMVAKGAMAAEGQDIDAVAGLVTKINELETEIDGLNRNLERHELWVNTDTSVDFAEQTITLNDSISNYKYYEIQYVQARTTNTYRQRVLTSGKIPINKRAFVSDAFGVNRYRSGGLPSNNSLLIGSAYQFLTYGDDTTTKNDALLIPYVIYGYKA